QAIHLGPTSHLYLLPKVPGSSPRTLPWCRREWIRCASRIKSSDRCLYWRCRLLPILWQERCLLPHSSTSWLRWSLADWSLTSATSGRSTAIQLSDSNCRLNGLSTDSWTNFHWNGSLKSMLQDYRNTH